mmetsp:Transcript_49268/g.157594  ORF Transcript_49268/g.157594 Transcript_49268/m.157594 type:complete len:233 (+) Transcript_49268:117-815(+)
MAKSWAQGGKGWGGPRQHVCQERAVGILVDWQHKAGMSFGWIAPIHGLPAGMREAEQHGGDVYVHWRDIQDPRPGAVVTFKPYVDKQGLGAEECVSRRVLRFLVPKGAEAAIALPAGEANPCALYLTSSLFYPELEERGVTLRRYLWDGPLEVYELWGEPEDIATVADEVGLLVHPQAEVLVSRSMARHEPPDCLRDVAAEELPRVPPRFRVALTLSSGGDARGRLMALLGA